jgi:amino acid adenylation domain-containing protein
MQSDGMTPTTSLSAEDLELFAYLLEEEGAVDYGQLITPRDPDAEIPLSFAQERLWFLDQWDPGNSVYNVPFAVRLKGTLSIDVFQRSLNEVVRRHEALRTTFCAVDGQPRQIVAPSLIILLPLIDLSSLPHADQTAEVQRLIAENAEHSFDLTRGPLLRAELLRLTDQEHVFLLDIHHIIFDGWSVGLFLRELTALYDAFVKDQPSPLPELAIQYPDFAIWQRAWLQGEVLQQQLDYWKRQLGGSLPVLELPSDRPRPTMMTNQGALGYRQFPAALSQKLHVVSQAEGSTLFMTLFAAFQILLYRYTGEEDIITGSAIANRDFVDIESLMGFFLNTLLLRTDLSGKPTFREFLRQVRETTLEAYAHQNVPFEQLVEELKPPRDISHTPLFQVMFILQNAPVPTQGHRDLEVEYLRVDNGTSKFDLTLSLTERPDGLRAVAEYKTDLFETATIERLLGHFQTLLESIVAYPDCNVSELPLLTEAERQALLAWNEAPAPLSERACIHQLFEAQAERTPAAPALVCEGSHLTYHELNQRANQLAHHLRALGVQPEERIGICVGRSFELIIGILGILKAGGSYTPVDPALPIERQRFILADTRASVLVTQKQIAPALPEHEAHIVYLDPDSSTIAWMPDTNPPCVSEPDNLAYIIYTSGSTGQPKGVMIPHGNLVSIYAAWEEIYQLSTAVRRHLQMANVTFDVFAGDLVRALCSGGTLVLCPRELLLAPDQLYNLIRCEQIDSAEFVPAVLRPLLQYLSESNQLLDGMRLLVCGSDSWSMEEFGQVRQVCSPTTRVINSFGVTEATIDSTWYDSTALTRSGDQWVPIGRPFSNTRAYILDQQCQLTPIGVPGELCLGGASLARGYLNRADLTAERFIPDPFSHAESSGPGARLYKTGDLVRWLPDGTIEFLGRVDHQVKIRGYRIEVGEVEAALRQSPAVSDAVVIAREDTPPEGGHPDKRLVAYIIPRHGYEPTTNELRNFLLAKIPDYMIPTAFMTLERLPLTASGKVNLRALPVPDRIRPELWDNFALPRTPTEHQVAALWMGVLKLEQVGIYDNFFELGGHSLLATQLIARLRTTFQVDLPIRHLFTSPTISGVAEMIDTLRWMAQGAAVPAAVDESIEEGEL